MRQQALTQPFVERLKESLVGRPDAPFVFLGNFEVEDRWAIGEVGLPRLAAGAGKVVTNRLDELALTLAGPDDFVILKEHPDPGFLQYLGELGVRLPQVLVPSSQVPNQSVTLDVLADPQLLQRLRGLAQAGCWLSPHGVSDQEESLALAGGMPLAGPSAVICKRVNSKVFSRRTADAAGLRQPVGWACEDIAEFETAVTEARTILRSGCAVAIKDAFGVSGKGILVVEDERRLDRALRMVRTQCDRTGDGRLALVLEQWVDKRTDINYQFTVGSDGEFCFDFVKEAVTIRGVHHGHWIPARIESHDISVLAAAADALAPELAAAGYFGVVGVDALIDTSGTVYPVIELNARNNMSTYSVALQESVVDPSMVILAKNYSLNLLSRVRFEELRQALGDLLLTAGRRDGLLVNDFSTVNAAAIDRPTGQPFDGKLHGLLVGESVAHVSRLDQAVKASLDSISGMGRG